MVGTNNPASDHGAEGPVNQPVMSTMRCSPAWLNTVKPPWLTGTSCPVARTWPRPSVLSELDSGRSVPVG